MSAVALVAFIVREWMAEHPIIDLRVFKERSYATGVFLMTIARVRAVREPGAAADHAADAARAIPSLQAGIAMAPRGMGSLIGMPMVGLLIGKIDRAEDAGDRLHRRRRHAASGSVS